MEGTSAQHGRKVMLIDSTYLTIRKTAVEIVMLAILVASVPKCFPGKTRLIVISQAAKVKKFQKYVPSAV